LTQQFKQSLCFFDTSIGRVAFVGLSERISREATGVEKPKLMAMRICDFPFAEDFQAGPLAFIVVENNPS
jgi:hypothetical protein